MPSDFSQIWSERWLHRDESIGLVQVYEPEAIGAIQSELDLVQRVQERNTVSLDDPFVRELLNGIAYSCNIVGPLSYHRISDDPPDRETVSFDHHLKKYVGLHIDSWSEDASHGDKGARNRVCINLGPDDRYLLFVNYSVQEMSDDLGISDGTSIRLSKPEIGRRFVAAYPSFPVVKLTIRPGEAYIAPTTHIMHDGCTKGIAVPVKHTAFRGYFDVRLQGEK